MRKIALVFLASLAAASNAAFVADMPGGLRPWMPTYAPAPVETVAGLQSLLKTDAGQALLTQNPALSFITRLDPQSETQRRVVAALGLPQDLEARLTAEALQSPRESAAAALALADLAGKTLPVTITGLIDGRVADVMAAVKQGTIDATQLEAAVRELAPFAGYSKTDGVSVVLKMAGAAREKGTLDATKDLAAQFETVPEAPKADYGWRAVHLMNEYGRDIGPSLPNLQKFSNERQIDALKVLLEHDYQIANKAPYLLKFNNFEQVFALRHMVEAGRDVMPSLDAITRFDNPYQGEAVKVLVKHDYQIADKIETILRFDNDAQLGALRSLVSRELPVKGFMAAIERVKTPQHAEMMETLAANIRRPAPESLKGRISSLAVTIGLLVGIVTILIHHALIGAAVFSGSLEVAYLQRRHARAKAASAAQANREWLNAHPEIEAALGPIEAPPLFASDWNRFLRP